MKANSGKSYFLLSFIEPSTEVINGCLIQSNITEVPQGITIGI